jgi:hypothetical protein
LEIQIHCYWQNKQRLLGDALKRGTENLERETTALDYGTPRPLSITKNMPKLWLDAPTICGIENSEHS